MWGGLYDGFVAATFTKNELKVIKQQQQQIMME